MFLAHATDPGERTLVLFDEVHHAGATAGWGTRAQAAFARHSRGIVSLTGTPFRTQADPIVFVPPRLGLPPLTTDMGTIAQSLMVHVALFNSQS